MRQIMTIVLLAAGTAWAAEDELSIQGKSLRPPYMDEQGERGRGSGRD